MREETKKALEEVDFINVPKTPDDAKRIVEELSIHLPDDLRNILVRTLQDEKAALESTPPAENEVIIIDPTETNLVQNQLRSLSILHFLVDDPNFFINPASVYDDPTVQSKKTQIRSIRSDLEKNYEQIPDANCLAGPKPPWSFIEAKLTPDLLYFIGQQGFSPPVIHGINEKGQLIITGSGKRAKTLAIEGFHSSSVLTMIREQFTSLPDSAFLCKRVAWPTVAEKLTPKLLAEIKENFPFPYVYGVNEEGELLIGSNVPFDAIKGEGYRTGYGGPSYSEVEAFAKARGLDFPTEKEFRDFKRISWLVYLQPHNESYAAPFVGQPNKNDEVLKMTDERGTYVSKDKRQFRFAFARWPHQIYHTLVFRIPLRNYKTGHEHPSLISGKKMAPPNSAEAVQDLVICLRQQGLLGEHLEHLITYTKTLIETALLEQQTPE